MKTILRIIDKETKLFIRDDFTYNAETEIGLDVLPAQGFIAPCWIAEEVLDENGQIISSGRWIEGAII